MDIIRQLRRAVLDFKLVYGCPPDEMVVTPEEAEEYVRLVLSLAPPKVIKTQTKRPPDLTLDLTYCGIPLRISRPKRCRMKPR